MRLNSFAWMLAAGIAVSSIGFASESSQETTLAAQIAAQIVVESDLRAAARPLDLINWKVGDTMSYNVLLRGQNLGTSVKSVTSDEGTAIWIKQAVKMLFQNEVVDVLISKADGKILKMKRNGQDMEVPSSDLTIISQDYQRVTVPAGTFDSVHIVAKTKDVEKLEVWANPKETSMDGTLKQNMTMQLGEVSMVLTSFKRN